MVDGVKVMDDITGAVFATVIDSVVEALAPNESCVSAAQVMISPLITPPKVTVFPVARGTPFCDQV